MNTYFEKPDTDFFRLDNKVLLNYGVLASFRSERFNGICKCSLNCLEAYSK